MIERVEVHQGRRVGDLGADASVAWSTWSPAAFDGVDVSLLSSTSPTRRRHRVRLQLRRRRHTGNKHTYIVGSAGFQAMARCSRAIASSRPSRRATTRGKTERRSASLATPGGRLDATSIGARRSPAGPVPPNVCDRRRGGSPDFVAPGDL